MMCLYFSQNSLGIVFLLYKKAFLNYWLMASSKKSLNLKMVIFIVIQVLEN